MTLLAESTSVAPCAGHSRAFERLSGATSSQGNERNIALDFTKGGLVLCMIVYHTLNYFRYDVRLLRHLHFLPPSFIFIAGFLITHVYLPRARSGELQIYRRLFVRGLKVLGLFLAINVAVHAAFEKSYNRNLGLDVFVENIDAVFLSGEQRSVVFGVLLPISYLLLLAGLVLRVANTTRYILHIIAGVVYTICFLLARNGQLAFNLELLSMGLLGMVAGLIPRDRIDRLATNVVAIVTAYAGYSLAITFWYPTYLINTLGVTLALLVLYAVGRRASIHGFTAGHMALLGNYSLLSYLVQIAVLQILFRASRSFEIFEGHAFLPFVLTTLTTFAVIKIVDLARTRSSLAARTYKLVFV